MARETCMVRGAFALDEEPVLFSVKVDSNRTEMMATDAVGDIKENTMHQPLLSIYEPLELVV